MQPSLRYFMINKPVNMVSQFKRSDSVHVLGELDFDFPAGTHAIGRLDSNSEGLLLLTTDKRVTRLLFSSAVPHARTYLVRVSGIMTPQALDRLRNGIVIKIDNGADYLTPPCEVHIVDPPATLLPYQLELNERVPHTWITMSLYEGKFHQVRKMVAAAGHQCRRLIRISIEDMLLGNLAPGEVLEMKDTDFFRLLRIDNWQAG